MKETVNYFFNFLRFDIVLSKFSLLRKEHALRLAAYRAAPACGEFLEWGSWRDAVLRVSDGGIVDPAAFGAFVLFHIFNDVIWFVF